MVSILREHERRVLDGHMARARGEVVARPGGPVAAVLSRLSGWVMAGLYPVWAVARRPFEPLLRPFAGRPLALRVGAALCALAVPASLIYMLMEEPEVELVRAGERSLARVTARTLNVRGGPGVDFAQVGRVYRDEQLPIVEVREGWVRIRLSDVDDAWVSSRYVEREVEPVMEERPVPRHGWIFLIVSCGGYLVLVGISRWVVPGSDGSLAPTSRPARTARGSATSVASSGGARSNGGSADSGPTGAPDPVETGTEANGGSGGAELTGLRAHLRAAHGLLLEGTSSSGREEFERLWKTFQRRVLDAADVDGGA